MKGGQKRDKYLTLILLSQPSDGGILVHVCTQNKLSELNSLGRTFQVPIISLSSMGE
jgi:hypothetical protein